MIWLTSDWIPSSFCLGLLSLIGVGLIYMLSVDWFAGMFSIDWFLRIENLSDFLADGGTLSTSLERSIESMTLSLGPFFKTELGSFKQLIWTRFEARGDDCSILSYCGGETIGKTLFDALTTFSADDDNCPCLPPAIPLFLSSQAVTVSVIEINFLDVSILCLSVKSPPPVVVITG